MLSDNISHIVSILAHFLKVSYAMLKCYNILFMPDLKTLTMFECEFWVIHVVRTLDLCLSLTCTVGSQPDESNDRGHRPLRPV